MRRNTIAGLGVLVFMTAAAGCGRTSTGLPTDLDGAAGSDGGRSDGAGAGGSGGGGADAPGTGGAGGGGAPDAAMDMRADGPGIPGLDALPDFARVDAPPASPGKIDCGGMSCDPEKQICCTTLFGGSAVQACLPKGLPCPGLGSSCDGAEDCPMGDLCCLAPPMSMGSLPSAMCIDEAMCGGGGGPGMPGGGAALCHGESDCPKDAPYCCGVSVLGVTLAVCSPMKC